jgi:hypothetical protein
MIIVHDGWQVLKLDIQSSVFHYPAFLEKEEPVGSTVDGEGEHRVFLSFAEERNFMGDVSDHYASFLFDDHSEISRLPKCQILSKALENITDLKSACEDLVVLRHV